MTYYRKEVLKLTRQLYGKEYLTTRLIAAKQFIDQHYAWEIGLKAIAEASCISLFHFIRLFKKYYGITPHGYLKEVRVAKAKEYLRSGMSVSEACFSVGFESLSSFTSLFKRTTGHKPKSIRSKKQF